MTQSTAKIIGSVVIFLFTIGFFLPASVEAASKGKTVSTTITNPASRCVTTATKNLRAKDLKQAAKDAVTYEIETDEDLKKLHEAYMDGLDLSWEAMLEPYCGFGSHGVAAAQKSYIKSVTRVRANFLAKVKKVQAEQQEDDEKMN